LAELTVSDVLAMPLVRGAGPKVVGGGSGLSRTVRWVHSSELADIGPLLREGDLLLSTGTALPDDDTAVRAMVDSLAQSGTAGLVIELGRRWTTLPAALVQACEHHGLPLMHHGLPLISLAREVRFAEVAQAIGERIVDQQLAELREAQRVHETFTELSIGEAGPGDILEAVQRLAGAAVVLESEQHHVLDYRAGPHDVATLLADWTRTSRQVALVGRTCWDEEHGWLVTRVGKKERGWGRLVVQVATPPTQRQIAMAERAAAALALHRLHDRQRDSALRRTHHELVVALLADPAAPGLLERCEAAGLATAGRRFVGVALRPLLGASAPHRPGAVVDEVTAGAVHVAHELGVPALVCELDGDVRLLLSFAAAANSGRGVDTLVERIGRRHAVAASAGRPVRRATEIDRTLREAKQVLDALRPDDAHAGTVHRLEDVGLRGLLALFDADDRIALYTQRQLGALREHDRTHGLRLEDALRALLLHPASKSQAAASLAVSRPVFYDRLARLERLLHVDLDDPDTRVSLHVALIADELANSAPRP